VGPKKVDPMWMEWIEESEADLARGVVTYVNVPTTPGVAKLLKNRGQMHVRTLSDTHSVREVTGELKVQVFLLGAVAERVIYSYAKDIIDDEAHALEQFLQTARES